MELFYRKYGQGPPMIILHGLYGMSDNWVSIARIFSKKFEVFTIDQRNHGNSPHSPVHNYVEMAADLLGFMDSHQIEKPILLGHSMGGKSAMKFSSLYPERVSHLIVVDIAPKSYKEIAHRRNDELSHHQILGAMCAVDPKKVSSREEIEEQLVKTIGSERIRQFLMKNVRREKNGEFSWQLNLVALWNHLDLIMDGVNYDELLPSAPLSGFPVLFIKGQKSPYITDEDEEKIKWIFPYTDFYPIPDAGHWVHAEQTEVFIKAIKEFLAG
jgi:pimeloyl-ACP methyl ester carboxylesterase